jgi:mRNA-degrading endonuclease RelE of RelBE toxin-antitoxin system
MQIRYTNHARQRMVQRRINEAQVRETVELPDDVDWGDEGETIALRRYLSHEIRVVYQEVDGDTIVIYTVIRARTKIDR